MRRGLILIAVLLCLTGGPTALAADQPQLPASAYLLMDAATGRVLYEHEGSTRLEMASTTKIMTAILALEKGNLSDVVTAGPKAYETGGSTIYLELGEQQTLENLLYALMLESANDSAVAIAEHLAGSEEAFAGWMNAKAAEIGAVHTHFANSHGLHDPNHYTTAHDLALIARYAMQNPAFRALVVTEEREIPGAKSNPPRKLVNHNRLLGYYEGIVGVKNGFTEEAGLTNVAAARRGDTELIAVVLGAQDRLWTSSMALLDYGFSHFRTQQVIKAGETAGTIAAAGGDHLALAVAAQSLFVTAAPDAPRPDPTVIWLPDLKAPLDKGARVGRLQVLQDGKEVAGVDLVARESVAQKETRRALGPELPESLSALGGSRVIYLSCAGLAALAWILGRARRRRATAFRRSVYEFKNRRSL